MMLFVLKYPTIFLVDFEEYGIFASELENLSISEKSLWLIVKLEESMVPPNKVMDAIKKIPELTRQCNIFVQNLRCLDYIWGELSKSTNEKLKIEHVVDDRVTSSYEQNVFVVGGKETPQAVLSAQIQDERMIKKKEAWESLKNALDGLILWPDLPLVLTMMKGEFPDLDECMKEAARVEEKNCTKNIYLLLDVLYKKKEGLRKFKSALGLLTKTSSDHIHHEHLKLVLNTIGDSLVCDYFF